ncbi:glutamate 5-kinase [Erysipelotrichaceae bacterium OttesenSCG-928-M19]|nr:glutamate 5-kinase [Erysipelotrichaceae bacterium OttesenSCG-928-M19]
MKKQYLQKTKRIVVKVGTSTLTKENAQLNVERIEQLVYQLATLQKQGYEVVFVSSGAVGSGNGKLNITFNTSLAQKQASAAVGQILLMKLYEELFDKYDIRIGQLLLTKDDITNRTRNLNARNTITELLKMKIIPVINENDSTVVEEIKVGDNDNLSALVAILIDADLLILLSDIDGIYTDNPTKNKDAKFLDIIEKVDKKIESYAKDKGSKFAVGGMQTKLEAAKKVNTAGINMVIANGQRDNILLDIIKTDFKGSLFLAATTRLPAKKKWLLLSSNTKGSIHIDNGAKKALEKGDSSLLPIGITKITGIFDVGSVINIVDQDNNIIAKGITNYSSKTIDEIKGLKINEFKDELKADYLYDTVVHIDNLVLIKEMD